MNSFFLADSPLYIALHLSRGQESIVEFYISSALHWENSRYYCVWQIFMRYLCNCGLEFWYCGISKHAEFLVIGWAIFSMVVSNYSIFLRGFTVFGIPQAALQSFFSARVYFCYKTGFDRVSDTVPSCGVRKLYAFSAKQYSHDNLSLDNLLCGWTHQGK